MALLLLFSCVLTGCLFQLVGLSNVKLVAGSCTLLFGTHFSLSRSGIAMRGKGQQVGPSRPQRAVLRGFQAKFLPSNSSCWVVPVALLPQRHVWQTGIYRQQTSSSKRWLKYTAIKTVHSGKALHGHHNSALCRRGCQAKFLPSNSSCWVVPVALLPQRHVWQTGIYRQQTSSSKCWLKYTAIKTVHSGKALHGHHNSALCRRGCQAKFFPINSSWVVPVALLPQRHVWQAGIYRQQTSSSKRWLKYTAIKTVHSGKALHTYHNSALCRRGCQAKFLPSNSSCWVVPVALLPQRHVWQTASTASKHPLASAG